MATGYIKTGYITLAEVQSALPCEEDLDMVMARLDVPEGDPEEIYLTLGDLLEVYREETTQRDMTSDHWVIWALLVLRHLDDYDNTAKWNGDTMNLATAARLALDAHWSDDKLPIDQVLKRFQRKA